MEAVKETKKTTKVAKDNVKMISVEEANAQMQNVLNQANARIQQITAQVHQLDAMLRDRTVDQLFQVIKYAHYFEDEFVQKSISAIQNFLTQIALTEPEKQEEKESVDPNSKEA